MTILTDQINFDEGCVFGLYGAGGFAREVMPLVLEQLQGITRSSGRLADQIFFIETNPAQQMVHGINVLSEKDFFEIEADHHFFSVAIADSSSRKKLTENCLARGGRPMSIFSPAALSYVGNTIGDGAIFCGNTMITSDAKVGKSFHANIFSYIAHDCVIGDYVTFAPRVSCNGHVVIEDHAYIGTGAVIRPGTYEKPLVIGEGAVVGMGAVVTKDVEAYTTVVGNPARVLAPKK